MSRVFIMLLDSFGVGFAADADKFGDKGSSTLGHIADFFNQGKADKDQRKGPLNLPNLYNLGLGEVFKQSTGSYPAGYDISAYSDVKNNASYAYAKEISSGKDTPSGHWEIACCPVLFNWTYFTDLKKSFPQQFLDKIVEKFDLPGYLGNCHASGTQILVDLGEESVKTGKPIFYTSADSVVQIAAHEEAFGLERLYKLCELVREELNKDFEAVGRVIARPFIGTNAANYKRTGNRRDYSITPHHTTILENLYNHGGTVIAIGKIADIYAHVGISKSIHATGLAELFDKTIDEIKQAPDHSIVFTNFVDFDSEYGHRRDPQGYGNALEYYDNRIPELLVLRQPGDLFVFTADHGNDPTWVGTDHTREHIPVLFVGNNIPKGFLGARETFSDIGKTINSYLKLPDLKFGKEIF